MTTLLDYNQFSRYLIKEPNTYKELIRQKKFCDKKYLILKKILAHRLNEIHCLKENINFWDKVLGDFLYAHVFQCARYFLAQQKKKKIIFKATNYINFTAPINCQEYRNVIQKKKIGQEKIFFEYLHFFKFKKKILNKSLNNQIYKSINFYSIFKKVTCHVLSGLISPKIIISNCFWVKKYKYFILFLSFFKIQIINFSINNFISKKKINNSFRLKIAKKYSQDQFVNFFLHTLFFFFPRSILEDFKYRLNYAYIFLKNKKNLKFFINESLDEDNLLIFALKNKFNFKTVYSEHNYLQYFYLANNLKRIFNKVDLFLSLGWSKNNIHVPKKISFLRTGSLFHFNCVKSSKNIDYLFLPPFAQFIPIYPQNDNFIGYKSSESFIQNTLKFLNKIEKNIIRKISYKPYNQDFTLDNFNYNVNQKKIENFLLKNNAKILNSKLKSTDLIPRSRLLLTDYLSTTFLQGFASNIPTIVIQTENVFLNNKFKDIFKDFYNLGIFHKKPESAAIFFKKVSENPDIWWYSKDVQSAINFFLKKNLFNEKNYISVILNLLKKNKSN
jgi:putative transferase (TIGR04331 family)